MRVICAPSATDVVYCGIAVDAGTRDELPDENGLAHFCEHLTFKGTHRRRSWHILNRMESVGGDLNAYTGKEETIYYTAFLKEHFARAVDLLADIVLGSTYPQTEMNKEVEVVIDEIESYNDSPSELIFDDFENLIFCGHPLGRNILGEAGRLRGFRSEDIQRFARRLYRPDGFLRLRTHRTGIRLPGNHQSPETGGFLLARRPSFPDAPPNRRFPCPT